MRVLPASPRVRRSYQDFYPEQGAVSTAFIQDLCAKYQIHYERPVSDCVDSEAVKEELLIAGYSSKSLEGSTLLADICDSVPDTSIASFLTRKEAVLNSLIDGDGLNDYCNLRPDGGR